MYNLFGSFWSTFVYNNYIVYTQVNRNKLVCRKRKSSRKGNLKQKRYR